MGPELAPFKAVFAKQSISAQCPSASEHLQVGPLQYERVRSEGGGGGDEGESREGVRYGYLVPFFLIFLRLSSCILYPLCLWCVLAGALALTFSLIIHTH